jgi:uncharacterized membrane protein YidH (DUF202 family)
VTSAIHAIISRMNAPIWPGCGRRSVIVLGLAIARFGDEGNVSVGSVVAGSLLLIAGTGVVIYGSHRYRTTARELSAGTFATARSTTGPVVAAVVLTVAMLVALVVLLVSDF